MIGKKKIYKNYCQKKKNQMIGKKKSYKIIGQKKIIKFSIFFKIYKFYYQKLYKFSILKKI